MKPTKPITDPSFAYTKADHTDIRATFARIRAEQEAAKADEAEKRAEVKRRYQNGPVCIYKVPR